MQQALFHDINLYCLAHSEQEIFLHIDNSVHARLNIKMGHTIENAMFYPTPNNTIILPWTGSRDEAFASRAARKEMHNVISRYRNGALHREAGSIFLGRVNHRIFLSRGAIATRVQSISSVFREMVESDSPDMPVQP